MSAIPKPAKRGPKPRKRIARKRKGKRASIARECDRLWSLIVRGRGHCENCGTQEHIQAAHGISRRYRATRWLPINGFALCRSDHVFYTHRPLEWTAWLRAAWGEPVFERLTELALIAAKQDMPAILARLREEARVMGIK